MKEVGVMDFSKLLFTCEQAKEIDMVEYLSSIGYKPARISNNNYWYCSPLREEKTASFKIDRRRNLWYDHGMGIGGSIIDFGIRYYDCSIPECLRMLSGVGAGLPKAPAPVLTPHDREGKIKIFKSSKLRSSGLIQYVDTRSISLQTAVLYCEEIHFSVNEKIYPAIGFSNDEGGYELRNSFLKLSSSPKTFTTILNGSDTLVVFEGFFDFLSWLELYGSEKTISVDFLILNSLSFFEKAKTFMLRYEHLQLYLDRDTAGQNCSLQAKDLSQAIRDKSDLYTGYNDLNDWLVNGR